MSYATDKREVQNITVRPTCNDEQMPLCGTQKTGPSLSEILTECICISDKIESIAASIMASVNVSKLNDSTLNPGVGSDLMDSLDRHRHHLSCIAALLNDAAISIRGDR